MNVEQIHPKTFTAWLERLPEPVKARLLIILRNAGKPWKEIDKLLPADPDRTRLLYVPFKQCKGGLGTYVEWALTGKRPDNKKKADLLGIDVKAITARLITSRMMLRKKPIKYSIAGMYKLKEVLRLTTLHHSITTTPYKESGLYKKALNVVFVSSYDKLPAECMFVDARVLDLSPHGEQSYNLLRCAVQQSGGSKLSSEQAQPYGIIKPYSHGTKRKELNTAGYNLSLYVYKEDLAKLLVEYPTITADLIK